jgi:tetraacyldisaccharide 4'-kinase
MKLNFIINLFVFAPLALVYGILTRIRNICFDKGLFKSYKSALPVISVGNITVGGTGKTPLVSCLVKDLIAQGQRPVVLSRGYGGSVIGPHLISENDSYQKVGDEPLMLYNQLKVPVVIAKKRVLGAKFIENNKLGNIIILDDGFQHRWLFRDLDIVCINVAQQKNIQDFINGRLLPWGIFRESKESALNRADIFVLSYRSKIGEAPNQIDLNLGSEKQIIYSSIDKLSIENLEGKILTPQAIYALCAIANPEGFFKSLESSGFKLEQQKALQDHSTQLDEYCHKILEATKLPVVITEKDRIKLDSKLKNNPRIYTCSFQMLLFGKEKLTLEIDRVIKR